MSLADRNILPRRTTVLYRCVVPIHTSRTTVLTVCVGFRFALAEMKALLFHIMHGFEFTLAADRNEIWSRTGVVMRPQSRSTNEIGLRVVPTPIN